MVVGLLGNESSDSNRFTLVTPKSENDVRLQATLGNQNPTGLPVGVVSSCIRLKGNKFILPYSDSFKETHKDVEITIPPILLDKKIKEIRIIPKADARYFEIQYIYENECIQSHLNKSNALALDLGVNNLVTALSSKGETFIIDGRRLKSINRWLNKENARLQSIKDKQHYVNKMTKRQETIEHKHNNRINDYMNKAARIVINYCIDNDIGTLIVGYNEVFKKDSNIDTRNNQTFVNIPYGILLDKLENICKSNGITLIMQEESYC